MRKSVVINCYGGPGCGKTTAAFFIACELKKRGYVTEYVGEYAKELVWEKNYQLLDGTYQHQLDLLTEQNRRLERVNGQVDFVVTDSPLLLNYIYLDKSIADIAPRYLKIVMDKYNSYNNFNLVIVRGKTYELEGRIQNLEESKALDKDIKQLLENTGQYFGTYNHETLGIIVNNAIKTYKRVNYNKEMVKNGGVSKTIG